jgi:hypothetical protein
LISIAAQIAPKKYQFKVKKVKFTFVNELFLNAEMALSSEMSR